MANSGKNGDTDTKTNTNPNTDSDINGPYSDAFVAFWAAYPSRSGGKDAAWEAWQRVMTDETAQLSGLLAALGQFAQSARWKSEDGRYIPSASKFLGNRMWECPPKLSGQSASCTLGSAELEAIQMLLESKKAD